MLSLIAESLFLSFDHNGNSRKCGVMMDLNPVKGELKLNLLHSTFTLLCRWTQ